MINIAAVSYFNTAPFVKGLEVGFCPNEINIHLAPPSLCVKLFCEGAADIALVPVGALPDLAHNSQSNRNWVILDGYCIGAQRDIDSVFLFSELPLEKLETIYLDSHSRTSNSLLRILAAYFWNQKYQYLTGSLHWEKIHNTVGGVVIGDKAVALKNKFRYAYDLASEWFRFTELPFVFAVWLVRPDKVSDDNIKRVSESFSIGLANKLLWAMEEAAKFGYSPDAAQSYYQKHLNFNLEQPQKKAIKRYLSLLAHLDSCTTPFLTYWEHK
jgi:chorismate dehydratase